MKKFASYIFIFIISLLFISRFYVFIFTQDVGVEHDSGWYLSVARNLAERGIYASSINTVEFSGEKGGFPSIHLRFSVQDKNGYVYFPAGVTVGPGFMIPEAIILKVLGSGWIQFKIFPMICFTILILLLNLLIYRIGGILGFILFQIWIWCYPQVWINQSFEAFSEQLAFLYLLVGLVGISQKKISIKLIVISGLFIGLSIQTKSLFFLTFPVIVIFHFIQRKNILSTFILIVSMLAPTVAFEVYRFVYLFINFGMDSYLLVNKDIHLTLQTGGSGLAIFKGGLPENFIVNKMRVWEHVGISTTLFGIPLVLCAFLRKKIPPIIILMAGCFFVFFVWYIFLSTSGWFRHAFPAVILGMIIISVFYSLLIQEFVSKKNIFLLIITIVVCFSTIYSFINSPLSLTSMRIKKEALYLEKSQLVNELQGPFFASIFSRNDQDKVKKFISSSVSTKKKLCYEGWFLVAELPPIVNRVIFPITRCTSGDILVIGPYQRGPNSQLGNNIEYISSLVSARCRKVVYSNPSYLLCLVR